MRSTYRSFHLIVFLSLVAGAAAQAPIYTQDFEAYEDGTETNAAWTIDTPEDSDYFAVYDNGGNNQWWGDDTDGAATWTSEAIDVSNYSNLSLAIFLGESGNQESQDFIRVNYVLDGSTVQLVQFSEDFGTSSQTGLSIPNGSSVQIQVVIDNNNNSESHYFDDIVLTGVLACSPISVGASNASVSLSTSGQVTVTASTVSASVISGDCFTISSYEVSKTSASAGFGASVSFDCSETGSQNIWVRATDGSNVSSAVATTVAVQDTTPPTIGALSGTYYLGEGGGSTASTRRIWWATATDGNGDNCAVSIKKVSKTGTDWGSATNYVDFDCTELGTQTLYLQGTDAAGNVAEGSGTITIADNTTPTITAPGQVNATTSPYGGTCSVTADLLPLGAPTTADNCSVASVTHDAPSSFPVGTTVVTWTVTDASGNTATAAQDVVVTDDQIPTTPTLDDANFTLNLGAVIVDLSDLSVSATDNCTAGDSLTYEISRSGAAETWGTAVAFDCNDADGKFYPVYVRATDASGNTSAIGVGYITISDPSVLQAAGQDVTVVLDDGGSGTLTAAEVNNGSQGNCLSSLSISQTAFDCSDVGANSVNLTISDGTNSDVTTVTVTVVDHCSCEGNTADALGVCGGDCPADADNDGICDNVDDCVEALSWSMSTSGLTGGEFEDFTFESTSDVTLEELNITMSASGAGSDNWASDLLVAVIDPSGNAAEWGGYNATFGSGYQDAGNWPEAWDSEADAGSPFVATLDLSAADLSGAGTWTVRLANGWMETDDSMSYDLDIVQCDTNLGCTDPTACNYDNTAVVDDGSCIDPHPELGCCNYEGSLDAVLSGGASSSAFTFEATGTPVSLGLILDWTDLQPSTDDPDANDLLLTITDPSGLCVSFGGTDLTADGCTSLGSGSDWPSDWNTSSASYQQYTDTLSLVGSGLQGNGEWSVAITNGLTESGPVSYGLQWGFEGLCFLSDEAEGCTDEDACNYDADAAVDDGSCLMPDPLSGCICEQTGSQVLTAFSTDTVGTPETFLGSSFPGPTLLEINMDFTNIGSNQNSWPSDMVVRILAPDASCRWFGGWDANTPPPGCAESDELNIYWPASWNTPNPGPLTAAMDLTGADLMTGTGEWSVTVLNGWTGMTTGGMTNNEVIYDLNWTLTGVCEIPGCTDSEAVNFLETATEDDGSCLYGGCLDELACNYDASADVGDSSCLYLDECGVCGGNGVDVDADGLCDDVDGCTDTGASNYTDPSATFCFFPGCTDGADGDDSPVADNYDPNANVDDGSCQYSGCVDGATPACNYEAWANVDDGSCDYSCYGCTDAAACNYDATATVNDGSCDYGCYGCTDPCAPNYDADATQDDGNCQPVFGCTDASACANYDPCADYDDGSCEYLDECGVCAGSGIPEGDCDCDGNQLDALDECGGSCAADADEDGICDDVDPCVGTLDACGVCNGPGAIYACGCEDIPSGDCDCNGNQLDALDECGGSCAADADEDGICDNVDPCVGALDACGVCNGPGAIYECGCADIPAGDCDCNGNQLDALDECGGDCTADIDGDGICDVDEIPGCTSESACNFNPAATDDDGSCQTLDACGICDGPGEIYECGCADIPAGDCDCNGNQLDALDECGGDCAADADDDGICDDVDPCVGSLDVCGVCNGPGDVYECGCADIPAGDCDCNGNQLDALDECGGSCAADADEDGICDDVDPCVGNLDVCGICNGPGDIYECGCADIPAGDCDCNGNQLDALDECGGDCAADADEDGICDDVDPCVGSLDACGVCNGPGDIYECGCADIPAGDCDCNGNQLDALDECGGDCAADADEDGICDDVDPCVGSLDACGICNGPGDIYECGCADIPAGDCDCNGNQLDALDECGGSCAADADDDGICDDVDPCVGTLDACGVCNGPGDIYECGCADIPVGDCDCDGNQLDALDECGGDCAADADEDGICDDVDPCVGSLDVCGVCNGPGDIYECGCEDIPAGDCDCNGNQLDALDECGGSCAADADEDGICDDVDPCVGALDACGVCNGPGDIYECGCADIPAGDCDCDGNQLDALDECGGSCAADADEDGICDDVDPCVGALDACGVCNGPGDIYECGCADIPEGDCDCNGNQLDALDECGGSCAADADEDGICDDVDPCVGSLDACGVCNGPGDIYECGCADIPAGDCDCDGNQLDALDECGGSCAADADEDGICDDVDPCVGSLDVCGICNGPGDIYECGCADIPVGDCDCDGNQLDALDECGGSCAADADEDGICDDVDPCVGSLDACGVCNGPGDVYECGCEDIPAGNCDCNGNQLDALDECGGDCAADADEDGICDDLDPCVGALDVCGVCNGPGDIYECGCADIPEGDCDCNGNQLDALDECGGSCAADADEDGICDDVDPCVGALDACGVCNGPGDIYECGCADIPVGDCDCDGNQLDALDECGGSCAADADEDGICDDVDPCVGSLDVCGICNGPGDIYECGCADIPVGDCDCDGNQLDALDECGGSCAADADDDGICDDVDPCVGSLDACGICNGPGDIYECGCADIPAGDCDCNGNQLDALDECGGSCGADADEDGICDDVDPCVGNLDVCGVCNGPGDIYECGCADIPAGDCDCDGNQLESYNGCGSSCADDADEDGICDDVDPCVGSLDACGICNGPGDIYECGCADIPAGDCDCNGNQLDAIEECGGDCTADIDDDGICDVDEIPGCTSESACNFNPAATDEDGSCQALDDCGVCNGPGAIYECGCEDIPADDCDCNGNQLDALGVCGGDCAADADEDGICDDVDPCVGTLDDCGICNGPGAVYECGCADIPAGDCDCDGNQEDAIGICGGDCLLDLNCDGICDDGAIGCTYPAACNYDADAIQDNGSCTFPAPGLDCYGECLIDTDGDGTCDDNEIPGCTDDTAVNFHPAATEDDGTCVHGFVSSCLGDIDNNGVVGVGDVLLLLNYYSYVCE